MVIPMTPLILDWQGYYETARIRPVDSQVSWQLAKAVPFPPLRLILIQFMLRRLLGAGCVSCFLALAVLG